MLGKYSLKNHRVETFLTRSCPKHPVQHRTLCVNVFLVKLRYGHRYLQGVVSRVGWIAVCMFGWVFVVVFVLLFGGGLFGCFLFLFLKTEFQCRCQAEFEILILFPQPPKKMRL